jgi:fructose-bisphosphate aldolase, class II
MSLAQTWLRAARRDRWALPAFNAINLETAQACVNAAQSERSPVILQFSQNAARYAGLELLAVVGRELRAAASVPVILHLDHAESPDLATRALKLGFDLVMLEGGEVSRSEQIADLSRLAQIAHAHGAAVEAEYEVVSKGERAATQTELTDLADFAAATGCDALAVSLGSAHKDTERTRGLDLPRLREIAACTGLPLVLHGASGVREADLRAAIALGIAKVNVATELSVVFTNAVRSQLTDTRLNDPRQYLGAGREAMTARARAIIGLLGASGRAATSPEPDNINPAAVPA